MTGGTAAAGESAPRQAQLGAEAESLREARNERPATLAPTSDRGVGMPDPAFDRDRRQIGSCNPSLRTLPCFFGYGSLVNRATHDFPVVARARLAGWRRVWKQAQGRETAFLSVERVEAAPGAELPEIDGLVASVPGNDWAALDEREWAYERQPVTESVVHTLHPDRDGIPDIAVYQVPDSRQTPPEHSSGDGTAGISAAILLSYLDVVVQGYFREFGETGARRFFETTDGWRLPLRDDRNCPSYPRHQPLERHERDLVDRELARVRAL